MVQLKRHRMKVPDEVPRHYPLDTRAEFRALYPAQAVLRDWWLGKGRAALVKRGPVPRARALCASHSTDRDLT